MRLGSKRLFSVSGKTTRVGRCLLLLASVFFILTIGLYYCLYVLRPGVTAMAKSHAKELSTVTVNRIISEKLEEENISVSDIVTFSYKENGDIASVAGNVAKVSRLKSDLATEVTNAISKMSQSEIFIPLGSLSGVDILYGTGPKIPLKITPYGYAEADIKTNFSHAGINQTIFEVTAEVSAQISVFMPTIKSSEKITTSVPVVSAVVVGNVPDSYTNVDRDGYEYEEDVLELAE